MRKLILLVVLVSIVAPQENFAQGAKYGTVVGTVIDARTGYPIPGTNVLLSGTLLGAATDLEGRFVIQKVSPGQYKVIASAIGYERKSVEIRVVTEDTTRLAFSLEETVVQLGSIVVTASKYQQALKEVPVTISLIQAEDMLHRNIVTVDQALKYVPGVHTYGAQVNIRGCSGYSQGVGSRVLVLLDGMPLMKADNGDIDWNVIAPAQIKQVEVMKGAGSALYGSSALGGVINIILKEPEKKSKLNIRTYSGFFSEPAYDQWRWTQRKHFEGTSINYATRSGAFDGMISYIWKSSTGFKENDDSRNHSFMGKFGYKGSQGFKLDVLSGYSKNKSGSYLFWKSLNQATLNGSDPQGMRTRTTVTNAYIYPVMTHILSSRLFYMLKGRWYTTTSQDRWDYEQGGGDSQGSVYRQSQAHSLGGEFQLNFQYQPKGILVVGCDGQVDRVNAIQFGSPRVFTYAFYLQNEYQISEKWNSTIGARMDRQRVKGLEETGEVSPKFGLTYAPSEATVFRLSVGRGFRAPSVAERFVSTVANMIKVSPNPELKPEKSFSTEFGINHTISKRISFDIVAYHSDYWNMIEPQLELAQLEVKFKNITRARIQGVETSCQIKWWKNQFVTNFSYTYISSKNLSRNPDGSPSRDYGKVLKYRPRHLFYSATDLKYQRFSAGVDFRYLSRIERVDDLTIIPDIDKRVPTYVTDLRFGIAFGSFTLRFLINNLFQYYYLQSPANLAPTRNYTLQLDLNS